MYNEFRWTPWIRKSVLIVQFIVLKYSWTPLLMEERNQEASRSRKKGGFWKCGVVSDKLMDKQSEIQQKGSSDVFETDVHNSNEILHKLPQDNSKQRIKKYCRAFSETNVSRRPIANTAKLKRVLSASELRTSLAGCPKGLLITTEPPKSGESYRQRSHTEAKTALRKADCHYLKQEVGDIVYRKGQNLEEVIQLRWCWWYLVKAKSIILLFDVNIFIHESIWTR